MNALASEEIRAEIGVSVSISGTFSGNYKDITFFIDDNLMKCYIPVDKNSEADSNITNSVPKF